MPRVPMDAKRDEGKQPPCRALPSRERAAGIFKFSLFSRTPAKLVPESNQTSNIFSSFSNSGPPHFWHFVPPGKSSCADFSNQISAPFFSNSSAILFIIAISRSVLPQALQANAVIGTPQDRK